MKLSKNCASNTKKEVKGTTTIGNVFKKFTFNLFKEVDTNLRLENLDAKQSMSLNENPRLHLTKFHDGMTE